MIDYLILINESLELKDWVNINNDQYKQEVVNESVKAYKEVINNYNPLGLKTTDKNWYENLKGLISFKIGEYIRNGNNDVPKVMKFILENCIEEKIKEIELYKN